MGYKPNIESIVLPDGRRAERHTSYDSDGKEVIEIFAEEARPLKLEKRVTKEMKEIVSKETVESIKDGNVTQVEVKSVDNDPPLQLREHIATVDHDKVVFGDYVKREELKAVVSDSVVAGVSALVESLQTQPIAAQSIPQVPQIRAQEVVAANVEEKNQKDWRSMVWMGIILAAQIGLAVYVIKFM